jgi:hypothetical protein
MKKHTTSINEKARSILEISRDEYALCSYIQYRSSDPRGKAAGWCTDTKQEIADFIGISRQGLHKMTAKLVSVRLLETSSKGFQRVTGKWIDTESECKQSLHQSVNKVYTKRKQSLHQSVNKVDEVYKELDNKLEKVEREGERKTPHPATFDKMMSEVERLSVEAKKEKTPSIAGGFPKDPTHTITCVEKTGIPGVITKIVDGVNLGPTNATELTIITGMNESGETYILEHTERVKLPGGPRYPLASNAMEAQKIIENWCAVNGEQIKWSYDAARRKLTAEDLHERLIDFCGHYATTAEKQTLFFLDPARMFQNGLTKWLQRQNKFDRDQAAKPKKEDRQPATLPPNIRRY